MNMQDRIIADLEYFKRVKAIYDFLYLETGLRSIEVSRSEAETETDTIKLTIRTSGFCIWYQEVLILSYLICDTNWCDPKKFIRLYGIEPAFNNNELFLVQIEKEIERAITIRREEEEIYTQSLTRLIDKITIPERSSSQ